jgi:uncharacterized protein (DUF952 family)
MAFGPRILHITTEQAWVQAQRDGAYTADSLATEGFIHCSEPHQVIWVANLRFRHRRDLVLLQIDVSRLAAPLRYENLEGGEQLFPHVYGPLNLDAVVLATPFPPDAEGGFDPDRLGALRPHSMITQDDTLLETLADAIAAAIAGRDTATLAGLLAPGFVYHSDSGQATADAETFLAGIRAIPGEIAFVRVGPVTIDRHGDAAMLTGIQHAQVVVDGQAIDDRRSFADFFVKIDGVWKLRSGADFPAGPVA